MTENKTNKVLLIGWDAAELNVILPLVESGVMPHFERLMDTGMIGTLQTIQPLLSPLLWNSIATGKRPEVHGVLGSFEPRANGTGAQPFSSTSRKAKAVWNILSGRGFNTQVIGWPATHPAEEINGVCVSDLFNKATAPLNEEWPLSSDAVHPAALAETFAELRLHPGELSTDQLRAFVPEIEAVLDNPLVHRLAHRVAEATSTHLAATYAMETEPWDFAAVYLDALDPICGDFMPFHPPRLAHIPTDQFALFQHVIRETYRFYDQMLGKLIDLAGEEATVILCSTHGYVTGELRPTLGGDEHAGAAITHRPLGFCVLSGLAIQRDEWFYGADILGVAPTILKLFDLPAGADMPGVPFVQAFIPPAPKLSPIPTWQEGGCDQPPPAVPRDAEASAAAQELRYNLGICHLVAGRPAEALPFLEEMHAAQPHRVNPVVQLIHCYHSLGRVAEGRALLETQAAKPAGGLSPRDGKRSKYVPQWDLMRGLFDLQEGKHESALTLLERAHAAAPQLPGMHLQLGRVYAALHRWPDAVRAFARALEIEPENAEAHYALGLAHYRSRQFQQAAEHAMEAAAALPGVTQTHLLLGLALAHLRENERAQIALRNALQRDGSLVLAHRALAAVYARNPEHLAFADLHRRLAAELSRKTSAVAQ